MYSKLFHTTVYYNYYSILRTTQVLNTYIISKYTKQHNILILSYTYTLRNEERTCSNCLALIHLLEIVNNV